MSNVQSDLDLYDALKTERSSFDRLFQEITDFVLPYHSDVLSTGQPGRRRGVVRYDSTGADSAEKLASQLGTTLTNPATKWLDISVQPDELNEQADVNVWLEEVRSALLDELSDSNFYPLIDEAWLAFVGYGTVSVFSDEDREDGVFEGPHFEVWPVREYVFTTNAKGRADTVLRMFQMTAVQAEAFFTSRAGFQSLGESITKRLAQGTSEQKNLDRFDILYKIGPRKNVNPNSMRADMMPVEAVYYAVQDKHTILASGFHEMPVAVGRWRKNSDDRGWGRGPGLNAMPDIRSLNEYERLVLKRLGKDVAPPWFLEHRGVIGSVRTSANGITYLRRGADPPVPAISQAPYPIMDMQERERRERKIRQMFGGDTLERLIGEPTPNMTAFEYGRRLSLMRQLLGATFGRIQREILDPIVTRVFQMLYRNGRFPQPPPAILNEGVQLLVDYVGPLARAQRGDEVDAIQQSYEFGAFMTQSTGRPDALDTLDDEKAMRRVSELLGVPTDVVRSQDDVATLREERQQQAEQQQALEQVSQAAAAAKDIGAAASGAAAK